jgi:hypothetical protein
MVPAVPREEPVPNVSAVPIVPIVFSTEHSDNLPNVNTATGARIYPLESVKKAKAQVLVQIGCRLPASTLE